ncbi:AsmA-like C-terminal region-containing protein [Flavobacterium sp. KACC 22763]|uniref:AsmA-like C-terminal region-containing protein n=1 Tax=Flavobacterium sp. KACC 22763 TaxID=3025668 RepID=UPI0023669FF2|nr:AsmA-like C-terminal region-containing protein [Flavobacterium sp. KACC 22763]WDF64025.1 AsmA-like C-terminal region-containing protein [Flavobacterium sp. KACC 22763]
MEKSKSRSIVFKIAKYTGITFAVIIGLLFLTPIVFEDQIKEQIKKTANERLSAELNYSDVSVSFFHHFPSLTLTLDNLSLNGSAPYTNEKFITAKEVSFGINVASLIFSKSVKIDQIYLSDSFINVKVNPEGEANYNIYKSQEQASKAKDSSDTALKLERIEILNSKIVYDDKSTKVHFDAFGFNYLGKGDLNKAVFDLYSKANIEKLNIVYEDEPYLMNKKVDADLITKVNINSLSFFFQQNNLKINQLLVDFKGKFDFLKDGYNMDFVIKSDNSKLYDVFTALPPKYITWLSKTELKGNTNLLLTLKGKYITSENIAPDLNLDVKVTDGFVNYNKSAFPVSNLNLDVKTTVPSLNPDLVIVDAKNLSLNINQDYLKSKFLVKGVNTPDINADFKAKIDLEKLMKALGIPDIELKGTLAGDVKANGIFDQKNKRFPVINGVLNLDNGYLKTPYYPNPITDITIKSKIENQKGTFADLKVNLQPTQFTFEGKPVFVQADLSNFDDLSYDVKAKGELDISRIYRVFSQKGLDLDGFVKADVSLKGKQSDAEKGNYSKLNNKGTLELRNIGIASEYLPKKFIIKEGIFKINQDKMSFNNFLAAYGQSDFKMNGYLQNVFNYVMTNTGVLKGSFKVTSRYINVDEFMSSVDPNTPVTQSSAPKTETKPSENTQTGVIIIPTNLNLQLIANAQKVNFDKLNLQNATGNLSMKNGKLTMQNTGFNLIGCNVSMNANYQAVTPQKANFDYAIKATDFDIKRAYNEVEVFRKMASAAEKAQGIVSLDYQLKGRLNANMDPVYPSLVGGGTLSVKDVKVRGLKMFNAVSKQTNSESMKNPDLSKVDIKTTVKNNIITVERFKFKFAGFRPRIEGTTSLDGKLNLKMRLGLPPFGIFGIPLTVTGTQDNPKVKVGKKTEDLEETKDSEE